MVRCVDPSQDNISPNPYWKWTERPHIMKQSVLITAEHNGCILYLLHPLTSPRGQMRIVRPAAEQSCPLLPNVHGQGSLGTTNLERNAHKCGKENTMHSHEGPSYRKPSDLKPSWIFLSFLHWGRVAMLAAGPILAILLESESLSLAACLPRPFLPHTAWISVNLVWRSRHGIADTGPSPRQKQSGRQSKFKAAG